MSQEKILYLTEQGSSLHQEKNRLVLRYKKEVLARIPLLHLERILVFGAIQITTQALQKILTLGIDVAFLNVNGRLRGRLLSSSSNDVVLRLAQYDRSKNLDYCLSFTRLCTQNKILAQRALLQRFARNHPHPQLQETVEHLTMLAKRTEHATDINQAMGYEGAAANAYFAAFPNLLRVEIPFQGRNRRPPRDPVNALLSFGYTLALNELLSCLESHGFDPTLGLMHGFANGRQSLGLDLLEEHRVHLVDRFVLTLFNRRQFTLDDFQQTLEQGTRLQPQSLQRFIKLWEERMREKTPPHNLSPREVFRKQMNALDHAIMEGVPYSPYPWEY